MTFRVKFLDTFLLGIKGEKVWNRVELNVVMVLIEREDGLVSK
jgi:hypothetical protein